MIVASIPIHIIILKANITNFEMRSIIIICLLVFQISYSEHSVCFSNDPATLLKISELPVKDNHAFRFKINNYANPVAILRNGNGTFLKGDFSTLLLISQRNQYEYISTGLSFKYPPQHRVAEINNQMLELQILYQLNSKQNPAWKHKTIALSVTFLLTEYAPQEAFTLGKQINVDLSNGSIFDLKKLLPLIPQLPMVLYKGTHTQHPNDSGFLWLVRKQLLLMSESELEDVKSFIFSHKPKEQLNYHGLLNRLSGLNEISELQSKAIPINDTPSK